MCRASRERAAQPAGDPPWKRSGRAASDKIKEGVGNIEIKGGGSDKIKEGSGSEPAMYLPGKGYPASGAPAMEAKR